MASTARVREGARSDGSGGWRVSAWLIGPWMLAAVVCGAVLVLRGPDRIFGGALALFLGASIAWILASVLWPARPDRTCPACGRAKLGRMDEESTRGVVCTACGHRDESQSSFLMAEEEGDAIERIRLATRSNMRSTPHSTGKPVHR